MQKVRETVVSHNNYERYLKRLNICTQTLQLNTFPDLLSTDKPDERQIMTYVSCYYHAFQGAMQVEIKISFALFGFAQPCLFEKCFAWL